MQFTLLDDGTLDTVILAECQCCGASDELRFDCEYASYYRDSISGALDLEAFTADCCDDVYCEECES